ERGARAGPHRRGQGEGRRGGAAMAAPIGCRGRGQPRLDRRPQRASAACAVLGIEGCRARVDLRDGDRPRRRGHPRELREPGDGGDAVRRTDAAGLRRSGRRTRRARRATGHRAHGRAGRGRCGDRLPRESVVGLDDRNGARRRRRHDAPAGAAGGGTRMKRLASVIGMPAENREEYERLHAAVWPAVLERLTRSNIRNYSIYRHGEVLFAYMEYVGDDFEADMAAIAADPATQEWWS